MMNAQYDGIAETYQRTRESPIRVHIEEYTFLNLIGDVSGKRILDLACGDGFYSRRLKQLGAEHVVGVDVSEQMIRLAIDQERIRPAGVEYICSDVEHMADLGEFDEVVAAYLLHYARSEDGIRRMCRNIKNHLGNGGRFVTLNENPEQSVEQYAGYAEYGFNKTVEQPRRDGSRITYWMVAGRELFNFHATYFARETYERVFMQEGFTDLQWHPVRLADEGFEQYGADYWREYLTNPPIVGFECRA